MALGSILLDIDEGELIGYIGPRDIRPIPADVPRREKPVPEKCRFLRRFTGNEGNHQDARSPIESGIEDAWKRKGDRGGVLRRGSDRGHA